MKLSHLALFGMLLLNGSAFPDCSGPIPAQANSPTVERRGCCSHHGGVCGCENGRALCCDGRLSPTCGC